jgi:bacteriorhodopsin
MENNPNVLPFKKINYMLMLAGIGILVLGFIIMSLDNEPHGFGFFGITLGPIIVMLGFIFQVFAILYNPRKS